MISQMVAALFGLAAVVLTYVGFENTWSDRPMLWALPVACAVLSLLALVHLEDTRIRRDRERRERETQEMLREITEQQIHGGQHDD